MIDINLLPPAQKQKRVALSLVTYITLGFITLLVIFVGFAITLTTIKLTLNEKISTYNTQVTTLKRQIIDYQSLESDVITINKKLQLIATALDKQMQPNRILDAVSGKVGPTITLTSLSVTTADPKAQKQSAAIQVAAAGGATERAQVIQFKRALEADSNFHGVTYTLTGGATTAAAASSSTSAAPAATPFTFTISATYGAPEAIVPKTPTTSPAPGSTP